MTANTHGRRENTDSVTVDGKTKNIRVQRRSESIRADILATGGAANSDSRKKQKHWKTQKKFFYFIEHKSFPLFLTLHNNKKPFTDAIKP